MSTLDGRFLDVMAEMSRWASETFGEHSPRRLLPAVRHLQREVAELIAAIESGDEARIAGEFADVLMIAHDALECARVGSAASIVEAKLAENRRREWGEPDADGVREHVRSAAS